MIAEINNLSEVRNIHKGHRAMVFGSGYSLNRFDFSRISENDILYACNQSITALKRCHYFCMTDGAIPEANFFNYGVGISNKIAFCSGESFIRLPAVISQYDSIKDKSYFFNRKYDNPDNASFNDNDESLIVGTDVIHATVHLAHAMGCSPIVLIGVDLNYDSGKKYCDGTEFKKEIVWSMAESRAAMWPISKNPSGDGDPSLSESYEMWKKIKNSNPGVNFLNASPTGRLSELFESFS